MGGSVTFNFEVIFVFSNSGVGGSCGRVLVKDVEPSERQGILDAHNDLRGKVARGEEPLLSGVTASDMMELTWDEELARGAQLWADQCIWKHDSNDVCRFRVGQNLYQTGLFASDPQHVKVRPDWRKACQEWYDEVKLFTSDPTKPEWNYHGVGHFTQLIWSSTQYVGCGYIVFQGPGGLGGHETQYYVCNYGPAGNYQHRRIYKGGPTCGSCPSDTHCTKRGLCAR